VRVAVLSYLNTDWYIEQMRRAYESQPLPISMKPEIRYVQGTNDYLPLKIRLCNRVNLKEFIQLVDVNSQLLRSQTQSGRSLLSFPY